MAISILERIRDFFIQEEKTDSGSSNVAKERLQFILVQDRIKLSPQQMEEMKAELIEVITRYVEVDKSKIDMDISREEEKMAMVANFPLKKQQK